MAGQGALVEHTHTEDGRVRDRGVEPRAHDLDFRQLRHSAQARPLSSRGASRAAAISACFLLDPTPSADKSATVTVAVNTLLWSGPVELTS